MLSGSRTNLSTGLESPKLQGEGDGEAPGTEKEPRGRAPPSDVQNRQENHPPQQRNLLSGKLQGYAGPRCGSPPPLGPSSESALTLLQGQHFVDEVPPGRPPGRAAEFRFCRT